MDKYISLVERACMQHETLKPGHVSNASIDGAWWTGQKIMNQTCFSIIQEENGSKNQKLASIFNVCFELKIKWTNGPP